LFVKLSNRIPAQVEIFPRDAPDSASPKQLKAVILHDDAKWTKVDVPRLDFTLRDASQYGMWSDCLNRALLPQVHEQPGQDAMIAA
jgi:hypothetical protein